MAGVVRSSRSSYGHRDVPTAASDDRDDTLVKEGILSTVTRKRKRFKVGDWVSFPWGTGNMYAQVIEERGPLGVGGRHIYRIRYELESVEPDSFEMPDDDLDPVPQPDKPAVMRYLKEGGLVAMLQSNLCGGGDQPRAWLTYTSRGELAHTSPPSEECSVGPQFRFSRCTKIAFSQGRRAT
jgi:hypothetical protein